MLFSSPVFVYYFLPFVLIGHFLLPRGKNAFLLGASLIFYAWGEPTYVAIIFASILINYTAGLLLARTLPPQAARTVPGTGRAAKAVLIAAVALNLGMLAFFKYFHFIVENMNLVLRLVWPTAQWHPSFTVALPLGISFFTFQAFSYTIDVYRRDTPATANLINFAAYITMFPQLVAGPIVRYVDVARELIHRQITLPACSYGVRRFIFGLGKKMLVANEMGYIADQVFDIPANELTPSMAWLGIVAYTLQIYFDFSGYSDMAIGMGRMLGFNFLENFTHPYAADSIRDFWRRWHISLSTWFRDYLYIPLGGNKASRWKTYRNLLLVFFLCGLWHGASWSFVIWGLYHGVFLVLERGPMGRSLDRVWWPLRHVYTLLVVMVGWVFFRAETLPYALGYLQSMTGLNAGDALAHYPAQYLHPLALTTMVAGLVLSLPVVPAIERAYERLHGKLYRPVAMAVDSLAILLVIASLGAIFAGVSMNLAAGTHNPFIYFRF